MKKITFILTIFIIAMLSFTACTQDNVPAQPDPPDVTQQPEKPKPDDATPPKDTEKELVEVPAIFYSTDKEMAEMLILDTSVHGNNITLKDDARVFFTDKKMNSLVKLKVKGSTSAWVNGAMRYPELLLFTELNMLSGSVALI